MTNSVQVRTQAAPAVAGLSADTTGVDRAQGVQGKTKVPVIKMFDPTIYTDAEGRNWRIVARDKNNNELFLDTATCKKIREQIMPKFNTFIQAKADELEANWNTEEATKLKEAKHVSLDWENEMLYHAQNEKALTQEDQLSSNDDAGAGAPSTSQVAFTALRDALRAQNFSGTVLPPKPRVKGDTTYERLDPTPTGGHHGKLDNDDYERCLQVIKEQSLGDRFESLGICSLQDAPAKIKELCEHVKALPTSKKEAQKERIFELSIMTDSGDHISLIINAKTGEIHVFEPDLVGATDSDREDYRDFKRQLDGKLLNQLTTDLLAKRGPIFYHKHPTAHDGPADELVEERTFNMEDPMQRLAIVDYFVNGNSGLEYNRDVHGTKDEYKQLIAEKIKARNPEAATSHGINGTFPKLRKTLRDSLHTPNTLVKKSWWQRKREL